VKKNQLLAPYTTFKIGGPVDWFCETKNEQEVVKAIKFAKEKKLPFFILGNGSNLLVSDDGFRGVIIRMENEEVQINNEKILAKAGISLSKLANIAQENSLLGIEFMVGIPGTLGGVVFGNAGAWQQNIGNKVERVKILDKDNQFKWLNHDECQFSYRQSRFKKNQEIILAVELKLEKGNQLEIKNLMNKNLKKRESQPKEPSAGSIFVNPKPQSAGDLIEKCGLKGKQIGQAQISQKHANFIVNLGGAKAQDVVKLIALARLEVKKKFKIDLETEIVFLGEFNDKIPN
jgi:UDP-N-acetylmuramate dehydrogenase